MRSEGKNYYQEVKNMNYKKKSIRDVSFAGNKVLLLEYFNVTLD